MTHPLHSRPLCDAGDLGLPIPDSPHAVSVCLPLWGDVTGYEENDPRVIDRMRTGYPRFFFHPLICKVRLALNPRPGRDVLPFANEDAARECAARTGGKAVETDGLWAAYFPPENLSAARAFWQHAGRILSSRAAEDWLASRRLAPPDAQLERAMCERLAGWSGAPAKNISLHPSGMAAIYAAFRMATSRRPGRRTVMFGFPYTDTLKILEKFGSGTEFFVRGDGGDVSRLCELLAHEEIAGIFCEFPTNPLLHTPDLPAIHRMATEKGVPVIVDDTIGTFYNFDVLPHADLVATSLTKGISGEGDVMAGSLTVSPRGIFSDLLPDAAPGGVYVRDLHALEENSRDFPERMEVSNGNALRLARFLASHPAVEHVWYPGLHPSPVCELLRKPDRGCGAMLSFLPRDAAKNSARIYEGLRVTHGISFGTKYTLVCPYVQLAHYHELEWVRTCGIDPLLLRVAVGAESGSELVERFAEALR